MGMLTVRFDDESTDSDGLPAELWVGMDGREQMYSRAAECTLSGERMAEGPVPVAECSECGSETFTDPYCFYCCNCGARIRRHVDGVA